MQAQRADSAGGSGGRYKPPSRVWGGAPEIFLIWVIVGPQNGFEVPFEYELELIKRGRNLPKAKIYTRSFTINKFFTYLDRQTGKLDKEFK